MPGVMQPGRLSQTQTAQTHNKFLEGGMMYLVLGIEPFKQAQVYGSHSSCKTAEQQANSLEKNKNSLCCQRYEVKTLTEVKKEKLSLFM